MFCNFCPKQNCNFLKKLQKILLTAENLYESVVYLRLGAISFHQNDHESYERAYLDDSQIYSTSNSFKLTPVFYAADKTRMALNNFPKREKKNLEKKT